MKVTGVGALLLLLVPNLAVAQECSALLNQGLYDIHASSNDLATASSFSSWYCDQKFSSTHESEDFGASLGFPFKGIPAKLGFNSTSQSFSQWYSNFCGEVQQSQSLKSSVRDFVKTVNPQIVNAFNACISSSGLHVWLERTEDPKIFRFAAKFVSPNAQNVAATITGFDPGDNVKCNETPKQIDGAGWRTRCNRQDDKPVVFTVVANWTPEGGGNLSLPAIAAPPSPVDAAPALLTKCEIKDTDGNLEIYKWKSKTWKCDSLAGGKYNVSFFSDASSSPGTRVNYSIELEPAAGEKKVLASEAMADLSVERRPNLYPPYFTSDGTVELPQGAVTIRLTINGIATHPNLEATQGPVNLAKNPKIVLDRSN